MVTIKDYKKRETRNGEEFFVLILQGGITPVKSQNTGKMYFTAKTCSVPSTFDEDTCRNVIGTQFPGTIEKIETEPYEYTLPETGEIIMLQHRWEYKDNTHEMMSDPIVPEAQVI